MLHAFVYGTLKEGHRNNHLLTAARLVGPAVTLKRYAMRCVGFPHITPDPDGFPVMGELYAINGATLMQLDHLESEGRLYDRRRVQLRLATGRFAWGFIYEAGAQLAGRGVEVPAAGSALAWHGPVVGGRW